ncbi:MAG: DUF3168 domain-containing protein [Tepidisphaeraceae bacterium]
MIGPSLLKLLLRSQPVYSVVVDRVYLGSRPQDSKLPAIVMTQVSRQTPRTYKGAAGYELGRMQIDILAATYGGAKELAEAVRTTLDNYSGVGDRPSYEIDRLEIEDERDIASEQQGRSSPVFGVAFDAVYQAHNDT